MSGRPPDEPAEEPAGTRSAARVLQVLEVLARHARPMPTAVIARECGIPLSSTHRLLNTMLERRFVTYDEAAHAWSLGVRVSEIGSAYLRRRPLQSLGRPLLDELAHQTGDTAHLAILHGAEVLYLDKQEPPQPKVKLVTEVGVRLPAHLTAVGRAMLADLPDAQVRAILDDPLVQRTDRGPRTVRELLAELRTVQAAGYAVDQGMVSLGVCCVAVAVFGHDGTPAAAIGLSFPSSETGAEAAQHRVAALRAIAGRLTAALGGLPPTPEGPLGRSATTLLTFEKDALKIPASLQCSARWS